MLVLLYELVSSENAETGLQAQSFNLGFEIPHWKIKQCKAVH